MRKKQFFVLIMVFAFLSVSSIGLLSMSSSATAAKPIVYEPIDIGPRLRNSQFEVNGFLEETDTSKLSSSSLTPGTSQIWFLLDDTTGSVYLTLYTLWTVGDNCEIWVQNNINWTEGDPRDNPVVTMEQVEDLRDEFDDNIYDTVRNYFGFEDFQNGRDAPADLEEGWGDYYDEDGKVVILVSNVRDANYYDPLYPSYIAGFFWTLYEDYFDRNIITIDAYDWENRVGPDGSRPHLYESIIAHEFQHLIHADIFPGDETYMNEACSLYAEPLCGYPIDYGQIEWFLATPDNSLIEWGDQGGINILADYGAAFLWAVYLKEHYGENFLSDYVQATGLPQSSIERINALLPDGVDFYDVFHDWRIANLLDGLVSEELYNYETLNLDALDPLRIYEISSDKVTWTSSKTFGNTYTIGTTNMPDGYITEVVDLNPFSTDYIALTGIEGENIILFDGDDLAKYPFKWYETDEGWHTKKGDLINILLAGNASVDPDDHTLTLSTSWDIEEYWDFGFVQISIDDGETWTSLENGYTTDEYDVNALGKIVDNLPGLTGNSGVPIPMEFDLFDYAGMDVLIGFRYITDWGYTKHGWTIHEASVSGVPVVLGNVPKEADFMVTIVKTVGYEVIDLSLSDAEYGELFGYIANNEDLILIISPIMEYGTVDYKFKTLNPVCNK